jgi:fluoride exporter
MKEFGMQIVVIALGGATGAVLRYLVSLLVISFAGDSWPYGTLVVNLLGSFFIGFMWQLFDTVTYPHTTRLLVFTGVLGAFTTFSTFGLESLTLLQAGRSRDGLLYLMVSNAGGLLCIWLGFAASRYLLTLLQR